MAKKKSQIDKFKDAAREADTNDSEEDFDVKLRSIAKAPDKARKTVSKK